MVSRRLNTKERSAYGWIVKVPNVAAGDVTITGGRVLVSVTWLVVREVTVEIGVTVPVTVSVVVKIDVN